MEILPSSIVRLEYRETGEERPELVGEVGRCAITGSRLISASAEPAKMNESLTLSLVQNMTLFCRQAREGDRRWNSFSAAEVV